MLLLNWIVRYVLANSIDGGQQNSFLRSSFHLPHGTLWAYVSRLFTSICHCPDVTISSYALDLYTHLAPTLATGNEYWDCSGRHKHVLKL
jgi:hypothetical protein